MPSEVKGGSAEERVLRLLAERYPITVPEVALALNQREDSTRLTVRRLRQRGLVVVEDVGGTSYVALSGAGYRFIGLHPSDAARVRKQGKLPPARPRDEDDPAFI